MRDNFRWKIGEDPKLQGNPKDQIPTWVSAEAGSGGGARV